MEYTKDLILNVNYGQVSKTNKKRSVFDKILSLISKHKIMTTVISITVMLIVLDIMLVASFLQVLTSL